MLNFVIKNIDPELWAKVKNCAAKEGRSLRFVTIELLRVYAEHGFRAVEHMRRLHRKRR